MIPTEDRIFEVDGRALDYPAAATYDKFSPMQIKALCEVDTPANSMFKKMPPWETQCPAHRLFYRLKAYWTIRGANDPGRSATYHSSLALPPAPTNPTWVSECKARGYLPRPINLRELEKDALPPVVPNAYLIIERCPQMAMIRALRGDVSEPFWWAALSLTEHATPNLSRECSDGYLGFSEEELAGRVARIQREEIKPALCSRIAEVNRDVCNLCKFKGNIRSPIALGYKHEPKNKRDFS